MGDVIYTRQWAARRARRPEPQRGIVTVDLELMAEILEEFYRGTVEESLPQLAGDEQREGGCD